MTRNSSYRNITRINIGTTFPKGKFITGDGDEV